MNTDQVELRQLRALVAVAEEGTFTDAAVRLGTSQSVISRTIARLESVVGVRLIERTTRTVALTAAGAALCGSARTVLRELDDAVLAARDQVRPLRLGYAWAAFGRHTSAILRDWRTAHPDVPIEVHRIEDRSAGLTRDLVDVAVVRGGPLETVESERPDAMWHSELLTYEGRMAALPAGHRLADRSEIGIEELSPEPVAITRSVGTTTLDLWPVHAQPPGIVHVDNIDEWLTVIASGAAVGVTPESTTFHYAHAGIVFVPLRGVAAVPVYLAWPRLRPHPDVAELAAVVRAHVASRAGASGPTSRGQNADSAPGPGIMSRNSPTTIEVQNRLE